MKIKIDVFGLKKWYKQLLDENFYKFLISLGLLASAPVIASVLFDYIVIYGNGRFKAGLLLGIVLLLLFLLLSFISIAIWAAINSNTTGQRRMMLIISAYLMIWLAFGNLYYFFSDTENFVATNATSVEGLVKEWDGDMHVTELQESTVLRNVPHFWELVPHKDSGGNEQLLPRTVNRLNGYLDCLYFSGVSILTIGYGDIVPESRFLKMLVLLEGFLGQRRSEKTIITAGERRQKKCINFCVVYCPGCWLLPRSACRSEVRRPQSSRYREPALLFQRILCCS